MLPSHDGNSFAVTRTPFTVKVCSTLETLLNTMTIPSGDNATRSARSTARRRRNRPRVIECKSTPFVREEVTTRSRSAFTQQQRSSSTCPLNTWSGPSIRLLLEVTKLTFPSPSGFDDAHPAAAAAAAANPGSDIVDAEVVDAPELPWMRHRMAVVSRDPVTRVLPSGERDRHVTGAQCPSALSTARAVSVATIFTELSACPPAIIMHVKACYTEGKGMSKRGYNLVDRKSRVPCCWDIERYWARNLGYAYRMDIYRGCRSLHQRKLVIQKKTLKGAHANK